MANVSDVHLHYNVSVNKRREGQVLIVTMMYTDIPGGRPNFSEYKTHGDWYIEGNFLITFDENGTKTANVLPNHTRRITERNNNDAQG